MKGHASDHQDIGVLKDFGLFFWTGFSGNINQLMTLGFQFLFFPFYFFAWHSQVFNQYDFHKSSIHLSVLFVQISK